MPCWICMFQHSYAHHTTRARTTPMLFSSLFSVCAVRQDGGTQAPTRERTRLQVPAAGQSVLGRATIAFTCQRVAHS